MRERKVVGILLLFSAFIALTTCQLQFNKAGNALTLQILIPANASRGAENLATNAKSLAGGTSVTVKITTQAGATWANSGPIAINGKTSVDYTFLMPPSGTYQVSAQLLDGSGNVLSQASTTFTVPTQTNPVVLTISGASGGIQLAWGTDGVTFGNPITNGVTSVAYPFELYAGVQIYYYQITNTSPTEQLRVGPLTITNNTSSGLFSVNVPPSPAVPPSSTETFEIEASYIGTGTYTETVTLDTSSTNPPDQTFTFTVTDSQCQSSRGSIAQEPRRRAVPCRGR